MWPKKPATEIIQIYVGIRAIKNVEYSHLAQLLDFFVIKYYLQYDIKAIKTKKTLRE